MSYNDPLLTLRSRDFLKSLASLNLPPLSQVPVAESRQRAEDAIQSTQGPLEDLPSIKDFTISSKVDGYPIPVRLYRLQENAPLVIFYHGGGWVRGSIQCYDALCRRLAKWSGCTVLSVGYRLAPENPFPTGLNDAESVYHWATNHTEDLDVNPKAIAVGGDSGGGNLTASLIIRLVEQGSVLPALQFLLYPALDMTLSSPSIERFSDGYLLSKADIEYYRSCYIKDPQDYKNPQASPLFYKDLSKFPPTILVTAECDPLHDEGMLHAQNLIKAGVPTYYKCVKGVLHGFLSTYTLFPETHQTLLWVSHLLKQEMAVLEN